MKTFVIGDIHGAARALKQCLDRSSFNTSSDHLIFLGDVCDRWPDSVECVDVLLTIKNLIPLLGNHDQWALDWLQGELSDVAMWFSHGGQATFESYSVTTNFQEKKEQHLKEYYRKLLPYYKDQHNRVFVHAGFDWKKPIEQTSSHLDYLWDRTLFKKIVSAYPDQVQLPVRSPYHEIYIGHSPTHRLGPPHDGTQPVNLGNVWCMDQGAGWGKKLSIMNIETKEVFQSDDVDSLY